MPGQFKKAVTQIDHSFINASAHQAKQDDDDGKLVQRPVRWPPQLYARVEAAAKSRGISTAAWIKNVCIKALDTNDY